MFIIFLFLFPVSALTLAVSFFSPRSCPITRSSPILLSVYLCLYFHLFTLHSLLHTLTILLQSRPSRSLSHHSSRPSVSVSGSAPITNPGDTRFPLSGGCGHSTRRAPIVTIRNPLLPLLGTRHPHVELSRRGVAEWCLFGGVGGVWMGC